MKNLHFSVDCPQCGVRIKVPFVEKLKAQAEAEWDLAETSAQEKLFMLRLWLADISLFGLMRWWLKRRLKNG